MQSVSVITLGVADLTRSKRFYVEGFGWEPVYEDHEIVFYQLNGTMLGTYLNGSLEKDMNSTRPVRPGAFALAQNLPNKDDVALLIERLAAAGGKVLRPADAPGHGGFRGYVADPDEHACEIAWNPGFAMDAEGNVTFGV